MTIYAENPLISAVIPTCNRAEMITDAISQARRKATVIGIHGQPADHPAPLVMPELDYLKFVLMVLD